MEDRRINTTTEVSSRLTRLETKMDTLSENFRDLKAELNSLQEGVTQLNTCLNSLSKEMSFVKDKVLMDIEELKRDHEKLKEKFEALNIKILGWSTAASFLFMIIGPKLLKIMGM